MHADLLPELMSGLDKSLQQYILKAKSGCGKHVLHNIYFTEESMDIGSLLYHNFPFL